MADELALEFMRAFVRCFKRLGIQELPPLVYQLLLLCNKRSKPLKRFLLLKICQHFQRLDARAQRLDALEQLSQQDSMREHSFSTTDLRHVEGTLILQINFAVKQEQARQRSSSVRLSRLPPRTCWRTPRVIAAPAHGH